MRPPPFRPGLVLAFAVVAFELSVAVSPAPALQTAKPATHSDSALIAAGAHYQAGALHNFFLGRHYRYLWATPIQVEVIDPRTFAGGLTPKERGGGMQTLSLRFKAPGGREYVFRTVDKDPSSLLPPRLRGTVVDRLFQDQISSSHPAGALVASPILDAAGVLHPVPRLAVLRDDPALGEFREFAGQLGLLEEYPTEGPSDTPGFAGATEITGSSKLLLRLNESPQHRVHSRAFLTARLVDLLLNDWDRHEGQWRWAKGRENDGITFWMPISRDRDQAFVWYDGLFLGLLRLMAPKLIHFKETYPSLVGLTLNSQDLDRRLLADLDRPAWDSVLTVLRRQLTDSVFDAAVARMPVEYHGLGPELAAKLKKRRDHLPDVATRFYRMHARAPDIHATEAAELALITRTDDQTVEVKLFDRIAEHVPNRAPFFERRFDSADADEIRIYLHGGDDRAVVLGNVKKSIPVRVIGGAGDNQLIDSSSVGGRSHAARGYDLEMAAFSYGPDTLFDRRPWVRREQGAFQPPGQDYGSSVAPKMKVGYDGDLHLIGGLGASFVRYGFRRWPYARRVSLDLAFATGPDAFSTAVTADFRREQSRLGWTLLATVPAFGVVRFHGLGNTTPSTAPRAFYRVDQELYSVETALSLVLPRDGRVSIGPVVQYSTSPQQLNRFIGNVRPYGFRHFGQVGLRARLNLEQGKPDGVAAPGVRVRAGASIFPPLWNVDETFGEVHAEAVKHLEVPLPLEPVLALRGGGKRIWGRYPYYEAAYIGGSGSVRGLPEQRFAGDASLYASAELRVRLTAFTVVLPGDFGVFGLADAGRVFVSGESSKRWHTALGGGIWFAFIDPAYSASIAIADSEDRARVYAKAGFGF